MNAMLFLGRLLFGGFFLFNGVNHFMNLRGLSGYASSHQVPMPELAVAASGVLLLLGSLSVLFGYYPRLGLVFLALFLIPVSVLMHNFWAVTDPQQRMMEMTNFLKNMGLLGACFGLMALPVPWPASVGTSPRKGGPSARRWQTGPGLQH